MIEEERFARLELELRRTKRLAMASGAVIVVILGAASATALNAVRGPLSVTDEGGKVQTVLQPNGDATFGGSVEVNGKLLVGGLNLAINPDQQAKPKSQTTLLPN